MPLTGVSVNAKVIDFCAEVTVHQRYENVESNPIEATYLVLFYDFAFAIFLFLFMYFVCYLML